MDRIAQIDAIIAQFDLNQHPFYQDWRAGTLPTAKLQTYGAEYGRFVATIAQGWETVGEPGYAEEERFHEELWSDFKAEIGQTDLASKPQTDALVFAAERFFSLSPEAVGALYAFEAQQPHTSRSKLDGLVEHYSLTEKGREYFRVHADDVAEAENLRLKMQGMSDDDFARAKSACAVLCSSMWSALDGVYYTN